MTRSSSCTILLVRNWAAKGLAIQAHWHRGSFTPTNPLLGNARGPLHCCSTIYHEICCDHAGYNQTSDVLSALFSNRLFCKPHAVGWNLPEPLLSQFTICFRKYRFPEISLPNDFEPLKQNLTTSYFKSISSSRLSIDTHSLSLAKSTLVGREEPSSGTMNFYKQAALALDHLDTKQGSVKGSVAAAGVAQGNESKRVLACESGSRYE